MLFGSSSEVPINIFVVLPRERPIRQPAAQSGQVGVWAVNGDSL